MSDKTDVQTKTELAIKLLESFHETGVSLPTRTMYLGSETCDDYGESGLDARMAGRFIRNLHYLESLSSEPISILMNNPGGDVYHGLAMFDAIKTSPCTITITVRGHAMSMGSVLLQAADRRIMGPLSTMMVHYGRLSFDGHAKTAFKIANENERIDAWMEELYLSRIQQVRPEYTKRQLRKLLDHDSYLSAADTVALGLADEVESYS